MRNFEYQVQELLRGAEEVLFIERDPRVIKVLGQNVKTLHEERRALIRTGDALDLRLWRALGDDPPLVVFLDPPYGKALAEKALTSAHEGGWLAPKALIVVEESKEARITAPQNFEELERRAYDDTEIVILKAS